MVVTRQAGWIMGQKFRTDQKGLGWPAKNSFHPVGVPDKDSAASKQQDDGCTSSRIEIAGGALNLSAEVPEVKMDETAGE
ncbi:hypothetical protein Tco_0329907, partial [Tanacetum coccineum]